MKRIILIAVLFYNINNSICCNTSKDTTIILNKHHILISKLDFDSISNYIFPTNKLFDLSWKDYTNSDSPAIVKSDFNGDLISDFAAILLRKDKRELLFCVFMSTNGKYKLYKIKQLKHSNNPIPFVVNIEKKGVWESADEKKRIKNDGVVFVWITDSLSFLYYFDSVKFVRFISD